MNKRTDRRILKIFLPGFRIQREVSILFIQDLPRDLTEPAKKAKINKHRGQLTCPRAQPHFQIRLAPKFQDGAGNTELHKQSRSFEETDRSEIERKSTCSIIELLLSEALPGYDLLKMTIVLIRSSGI